MKKKATPIRKIKSELGDGLFVTQIGGIVSAGREQGNASIAVHVYKKGNPVFELDHSGVGRISNNKNLLAAVRKALTDSVAFVDQVAEATATEK